MTVRPARGCNRAMRLERRAAALATALALAGCKSDYSPAGTYAGTLTEHAQVLRTANPDAANAVITTRPNPHAEVTVEPAGERRVRVRFSPTCAVLYELGRAPNEQVARVATRPEQTCAVDVNGFRGAVRVSGTARFARGSMTVTQIDVRGELRDGQATGSWSLDFDGTTPTTR